MAARRPECVTQRRGSLLLWRCRLLVSAVLSLLAGSQLCSARGTKTNLKDRNYDYSYPYKQARFSDRSWYYGSATFYTTTNVNSCGQPWSVINTNDVAATPEPRFSNYLTPGMGNFVGAACGQCFEVRCAWEPRYAGMVFCRNTQPMKVRIVDYDAPNHRPYPWPNNHFDLKPSSFAKIADPVAGIINIQFRRVPCNPTMKAKWYRGPLSNNFWHDYIIYDVPLTGSVAHVYVMPPNQNRWIKGQRLWGLHWQFLGTQFKDPRTKVKLELAENKGQVTATYAPTS